MKPFKAHFTKQVFKVVNFLPWLFPKWLSLNSKLFLEMSLDNEFRKREDELKFGSFFDDTVLWKALSVTVQISHDDIKSIHTWLKNKPFKYDPEIDSHIFSTNYTRSNSHKSLGWITLNKKQIANLLADIKCDSMNYNSCYVSLDLLPRGFSYLTMYFLLSDKATSKISDIDTSSVERYENFNSFNPLSKKFKIIEQHSRNEGIELLIKNNFNEIINECKSISITILKLWNIDKNKDYFNIIADFYRNCNEPYFYDLNKEINYEQKNSHLFLINKFMSCYDLNISNEKQEVFFQLEEDFGLSIDAFYM